MRSGHAVATVSPVIAAGVGLRRGPCWVLRSASFRLEQPGAGGAVLGIVADGQAAAPALIDLLAGRTAPGYGVLRVLGHDLTTVAGRRAARGRIGIAIRGGRPLPGVRVRGLVERSARTACGPDEDRRLLVAAILDRLALAPWAEVPIRSAPELVARRARIAAAAVRQPELLLMDGLLDDLSCPDLAGLIETMRDLERDTALIVTGGDRDAITQACPEMLVLAGGVLIGNRPPTLPPAMQCPQRQPAYCD